MSGMSVRARVLVGAALWTLGLFVITGCVFTVVMLRHPRAPGLFHNMFEHWLMSMTAAAICMVWGLWQVRRGLLPIRQLRSRLSAVRSGSAAHVDGDYPAEVQPLVDDLNALLQHRERAVNRAVAKAGDLAHGLKTPLAVLSREAERAAADGHPDVAAAIGEQVERMRRQIDYHLAQARAAASGATPGARCLVSTSAEGLARTMLRLQDDRGLAIDVDVAPADAVRCQREDLDEMLGNLLDNACKWAKSRVTVSSSSRDGAVVIAVEDDGPGLDPSMRDAVLQRGVRADEAAPGSGLGLAIVRDLAELYGGSIELGTSAAGGLRATLKLPRS